MSLVEHVEHIIRRFVQPEDRFLLAVSGGKDSMVLFHVFTELKLNFEVAHMNYGLRPEDANLDEDLVKKVAKERSVKCHTKRVNTKSFCKEEGYATQEGARILRYNWFNDLIKTNGFDWIVTAHHEEDNKETFIQNLKRGSGLRGLKAMKVVHENKFKPMLNVPKAEIDHYAIQKAVDFRQDASNNQNHYQRNLIRNEVLPYIEEKLPGVGKGISTTISNLQNDYDYLSESLNKEAARLLIPNGDGWKINEYKSVHSRVLFHILEKYQFNAQQVEDILRANSSGKTLQNEAFVVVDGHGDLYIEPTRDESSAELKLDGIGEYDLGNQRLVISTSTFPKSFDRNKQVAYVDEDKIQWPLLVRKYKAGDRIRPIGLHGSKKLSDYFTDAKIPKHQRAKINVVVSGEEIIWIVGEMVSESVKLTTSSKKVLKFETY